MPWIKFGDTVAHINLGRSRPRKREMCSWCNRFLMDVLCDFRKPGQRKTCSKPLCKHCAEHCEPDLDYCPCHEVPQAPAPPATQQSFFDEVP